MKKKQKAFTLIELLVVIAAIIGLAALTRSAAAQGGSVAFSYDNTQLRSIKVNGIEMLTGNGGYLIWSPTGADGVGPLTGSPGSDGARLTGNGPAFSLRFSRGSTPNTLHFRAQVTLDNRNQIASLSLPFDFDKKVLSSWSFGGTQYRLNNESSVRNGSGGTYAGIPQPFRIPAQGPLITYTGFAKPTSLPSWGQVAGSVATVRLNITGQSNAQGMLFYNHGFTNNMEIGLAGITRGQTAWVEGDLIVTPNADPQVRFESERDFSHQVGRSEADGWSVNVRDLGRRFMSYGPYVTNFNGNRSATFLLMFDNVTADNLHIVTVDVYDAASNRVLASRQVRRRDLTRAGVYQPITLNFSASTGSRLEFRTYLANAVSYVRQDAVIIR